MCGDIVFPSGRNSYKAFVFKFFMCGDMVFLSGRNSYKALVFK